jgi:hypothetical protein
MLEGLSVVNDGRTYDAILVALQPRPEPVLSAAAVNTIAERWPGALVAQFWGDLDRAALVVADVPVWPPDTPLPGHMGILPSGIGPEPIVRLQTGGLKAAEVLSRSSAHLDHRCSDFVEII